jgi:hypothetical protein
MRARRRGIPGGFDPSWDANNYAALGELPAIYAGRNDLVFEGKYFWKMPPDVETNVGPTVIHPLPKAYREMTERYSRQVEISELPDGAFSLRGYRAGQPFPNPANPHKGWKILANVWYRYLPHLLVGTQTVCTQDQYGSIRCGEKHVRLSQLSYNTGPDIPETVPGAQEKFYTLTKYVPSDSAIEVG